MACPCYSFPGRIKMKWESVSSMLKAVKRVDFSIIKANRKQKIKSCQQVLFLTDEGESNQRNFLSFKPEEESMCR